MKHLPDTMIAATAVNHRLTLMKSNEGEFRNTGVSLVNPVVAVGFRLRPSEHVTTLRRGNGAESWFQRERSERWNRALARASSNPTNPDTSSTPD